MFCSLAIALADGEAGIKSFYYWVFSYSFDVNIAYGVCVAFDGASVCFFAAVQAGDDAIGGF